MSISTQPARSHMLAALRVWAADGLVVAMVGLITATFSLSYAALLFGGAPGVVPAQGLFVLLVSSVVLSAVMAGLGSVPFAFNTLEGSSVAAMAGGMAAITAGLAGGPEPVLAATLLVALPATALVTGAVALALASTGLGNLVRTVPLQVVAGLFAGSGWALLAGGAAVAVGQHVTPGLLLEPAVLGRLGAAVVGMAVLVVGVPLLKHAVALPLLVASQVVAYHLGAFLMGWPLVQQRAAGWLLQPVAGLNVVVPWSPSMLAAVDWTVLLAQWPALGATVAITVLGLLLNLGGIEVAANHDADLDRGLRAGGWANLAAGLCGGAPGIVSVSRSMLLFRLGSRRRATTVMTGLVAGLAPMLVPGLLGVVPRPVLGALLLYIAYGILKTWSVDIRKRLTGIEWATVAAVVLVVVQFGLAGGVVAGIALGCATFALTYSRASPIRARFQGNVAQSHVARSMAERAVLDQQADTVLVLYLQGFLFFGTINRVLVSVRGELARTGGQLRHLVLDGSNIDGLDGSARATLTRLVQATHAAGVELVFAGFPAGAQRHLAGLAAGPGVRSMPTLDAALESIEDGLLSGQALAPAPPLLASLAEECAAAADMAALAETLAWSDLPAGAALMAQGEASDHLMFIEAGGASVMIEVNGASLRARRYGPGTMLGEVGFLLGKPRTATVLADVPTRIRVLTRAGLASLEAGHPQAAVALQRLIMRQLAERLVDRDALIHSLLRGTRAAGSD